MRTYIAVYSTCDKDADASTATVKSFVFQWDKSNVMFSNPITLAYTVVDTCLAFYGLRLVSFAVHEVRPVVKPIPRMVKQAIQAYSEN